MYKDNAVGTVVAETGRDCWTTARLSDLSMPFQLCVSSFNRGQRWIVKRRWSQAYAFSYRRAHPGLCLTGGWGKRERFDVAARSEAPKLSCHSHKQ